MKKIAFLLLACFLILVVLACSSEPASTPSSKADVGPIREYACELANRINEFNSRVERFEATESRGGAADICREIELGYRELKAEDCPSELSLARDHVLGEIRKYLDGAWDWAAIEEKDERFKRELKENISADVEAIRANATELVSFIDEFYGFVRDFEGTPRGGAPALCEGMELSYHEFQAVAFPSQLKGAQSQVLGGVRAYLEKAWDWAVSAEGDEVKREYKSDVFEWEAVPTPECTITPIPVP